MKSFTKGFNKFFLKKSNMYITNKYFKGFKNFKLNKFKILQFHKNTNSIFNLFNISKSKSMFKFKLLLKGHKISFFDH
jgi:hypothetical protein